MKSKLLVVFLLAFGSLSAQTQCLNTKTVKVYFENMWFDYSDIDPQNYDWADVTACVEIDWDEMFCVPEEVEWYWMMETEGQRVALTAPGTNVECISQRIYGTTSFWVCITANQEGSSLEEFPLTARTKAQPCDQSSLNEENNDLRALVKRLQSHIKQAEYVESRIH